jgi:hypothetical protein
MDEAQVALFREEVDVIKINGVFYLMITCSAILNGGLQIPHACDLSFSLWPSRGDKLWKQWWCNVRLTMHGIFLLSSTIFLVNNL